MRGSPTVDDLLWRRKVRGRNSAANFGAHQLEALASLEQQLSDPTGKPARNGWRVGLHDGCPLSPLAVERAQRIYLSLLEVGGARRTYAEETILGTLAVTASASSVPFWVSLLELKRARDSFSTQRRAYALAALGMQFALSGGDAPRLALERATHHENGETRALAVEAWVEAARRKARIDAPMLERVLEMASQDPAFPVRFSARRQLVRVGQTIPLDNPGGVYRFEVQLRRDACMVQLDLPSEAYLDQLCSEILKALRWDSDHLWEFRLNGEKRDGRYTWPSEEQIEAASSPWTEALPKGVTAEPREFAPKLGELGLAVGHVFTLLFDFGDHHLFRIKVIGIGPRASGRVEYPRVVSKKGKVPNQYC